MTYLAVNGSIQKNARMIELSLSSAQTASQGDTVIFDQVKATGSHGVSVDVNGNISLDTSKAYFMQASIDVIRSSTTSSWQFGWYDGATALTESDNAYKATWVFGAADRIDEPNATFTATYVTGSPISSVSLKAIELSSNSSISTDTRLFIVEVDQ